MYHLLTTMFQLPKGRVLTSDLKKLSRSSEGVYMYIMACVHEAFASAMVDQRQYIALEHQQ